jgi:hypothetical protein
MTPMHARLAADTLVLLHLAFVAFALLGALVVAGNLAVCLWVFTRRRTFAARYAAPGGDRAPYPKAECATRQPPRT